MKFTRMLMIFVFVLPIMGADGGSCGGWDDQSGVVPPTETKCSPQTCAEGCCLGGVCYTNETRETCGSFGVACAMCKGSQSCQLKDPARGWECLTDSSANWSIQPMTASIPPLDPSDGAAWDADDSEPDVVVEMDCPVAESTVLARTSEVSNYTPKWIDGSCVAKAGELLKSPLRIRVVDVDAFFDDPLFSGAYTFKETDFEKGTVEISIFEDGSSKLQLRLSRLQ